MSADDIIEIEQLVARYNMAIDDGDGETYAATYVEDGEFVSPDSTLTGREALTVFGDAAKGREVQVRHWVSSIEVAVDGDAATARSNLMLLRVGAGGPSVVLTGRYADQLRRTEHGWRFMRRAFTPDR